MKKKCLAAIMAVCLITFTGCKSSDYKKASELYSSGKYEAAKNLYSSLGGYKDSAVIAAKIDDLMKRYDKAKQLYEEKNYQEAKELFIELGDFNDSKELTDECDIKIYYSAVQKILFKSAYYTSYDLEVGLDIAKAIIFRNEPEFGGDAKEIIDKDLKEVYDYYNNQYQEDFDAISDPPEKCADLHDKVVDAVEKAKDVSDYVLTYPTTTNGEEYYTSLQEKCKIYTDASDIITTEYPDLMS